MSNIVTETHPLVHKVKNKIPFTLQFWGSTCTQNNRSAKLINYISMNISYIKYAFSNAEYIIIPSGDIDIENFVCSNSQSEVITLADLIFALLYDNKVALEIHELYGGYIGSFDNILQITDQNDIYYLNEARIHKIKDPWQELLNRIEGHMPFRINLKQRISSKNENNQSLKLSEISKIDELFPAPITVTLDITELTDNPKDTNAEINYW